MFARWAQFVVRARWAVLAAGLVLVVLGVTWGTGVFGVLSGGGFNDPHTASNGVRQQITQRLGDPDADILALYSSPALTVDDPAFRSAVNGALDRVRGRVEVVSLTSYLETPAPALVSKDRHATYVLIQLRPGDDTRKQADYRALRGPLEAGDGLTTQLGGVRPFLDDASQRSAADVKRAEELSMPVLLVLLVIIFGSLVAAAAPLVIGGVAILRAV